MALRQPERKLARKSSWIGIVMAVLMLSLVLYSCIAPASAIEFSQYEKIRKTELFKQQIYGVNTGYFWANAGLGLRRQPLLYCQPDMALNAEKYLQILNASIEDKHHAGNGYAPYFPLEAILLQGLHESFPCK